MSKLVPITVYITETTKHILRNNKKRYSIFGREAIKDAIEKQSNRYGHEWYEREESILKILHNHLDTWTISLLLHRTQLAIKSKIYKLGLSCWRENYYNKWATAMERVRDCDSASDKSKEYLIIRIFNLWAGQDRTAARTYLMKISGRDMDLYHYQVVDCGAYARGDKRYMKLYSAEEYEKLEKKNAENK